MVACVTSDIVNGVCLPISVYSSVAAQKTIGFFVLFVGYILPLALMIVCYSRIVYKLHTQVTVPVLKVVQERSRRRVQQGRYCEISATIRFATLRFFI